MERGKQTFDLTTLKGVAFEYEVIGRQREPAAEQDALGGPGRRIEPRFGCQTWRHPQGQ
jgi:hypothetical protein